MTTATLGSSPQPPAAVHDAVLYDLDGVVYRGADPVEHAAEAIQAAADLGGEPVYVTNNASRPPAVVAEQLTGLGIPTNPDRVMTASLAAAQMLAEMIPAGSTVLCVGGAGVFQAVEAAGFTPVTSADEQPAAVVQGYGPQVGWAELTEAAFAIQRGARFVATNLDSTLPTERGMAVGNGSLVAAVINATGVHPTSSGKPEAGIFRAGADLVGAKRPMVVGDRLNTDLAGARAAGYPGLHVLTGVSQVPDLLAAIPAQRPDLLAIDLRGLTVAHPEIVRSDSGWHCRQARVTQTGQLLRDAATVDLAEVSDLTLDELRALCVAHWDAADRGHPLPIPDRTIRVEQEL